MELLSVIRRWRHRDNYSIREISRRTGLSRNTVRKYLRSDSVEPKFNVPDRPSKLDHYADKLSHMLRQETGKSRKQKRTIKRAVRRLGPQLSASRLQPIVQRRQGWEARHGLPEPMARVLDVLLDLPFLPTGGRVAELGLEQEVADHG